ncbi:MAG: hypothetical protein RBS39_05775 [Phycisphaerales bacterium]|nr:hypothetical protein [Phycisphaerales bacterium]
MSSRGSPSLPRPRGFRPLAWAQSIVTLGALVVLAGVGYEMLASRVAASMYRARLDALGQEYAALRDRYNDAVRRTAVTELIVRGGSLSVRVRTIDGVERVIETPFDPRGEIYIDYVVLDGRLWIRRIFDVATPPGQAMVIEPDLAEVQWRAPNDVGDVPDHGKAVYRTLSDGRWIVTTTGDGALGLKRAGDADEGEALALGPAVRSYEEVLEPLPDPTRDITWGEVLGRVVGAE